MKLLIIRFSSFGDIVQAMSVLPSIKNHQQIETHWLTKTEFSALVSLSPLVDKVHHFDTKLGIVGLIKLGLSLRKLNFTHVYDAHSNPRSFVLKCLLFNFGTSIFTRSKERIKRILLFKFSINLFEWPYRGMKSFLLPLVKNGLSQDQLMISHWDFKRSSLIEKLPSDLSAQMKSNIPVIALVPGAAWDMKRWPLDHFKKLIQISNYHFVLFGGAKESYLKELEALDPSRITNLAGKLSLIESCELISKMNIVVTSDTGLLHVADTLNIKTIALIGPTAFGFPSFPSTFIMEKEMSCRPCTKDGRGKCSQSVYQKCLVDITPEDVLSKIQTLL